MRIFKYTGHITNILDSMHIKVSAATHLNDPFELTPRIDPSRFTIEATEAFLSQEEHIRKCFRLEGQEKGFTDYPKFRRYFFRTLRQRAKDLKKGIPDNVKFAKENYAKSFSNHWNLFCASKRYDSILMWSHYARNHEGAVAEFETADENFQTLEAAKLLFDVVYSKTRAEFDIPPDGNARAFYESMINVARSKSEEWDYEQEVRALVPYEVCTGGFFLEFTAPALRRVYLGVRMAEAEEKKILHLVDRPEYAHVGIKRAELSAEQYGLDFREIKPERAPLR